MSTPGYRIRLHSSLTTPIMFGGTPRKFSILNWTICAAVVLGLQAYYLLPLFIVLHVVAAFFAKKDPLFFEVILRHLRQKRFYRV